ncbi:heme oxygenase (biliverdin-producing) [uncultured Microbacterium sp.]|uniref:heme oxygenase (biliverdin-producing) n=1 Tax=uncultured Microbacterium sp. TaxID=191216 RepID=A0A1Y5P552_9MICO|nr:biliverdin-producing heme oxygenase [uncultured Microbacterium sp.]SBS72650.1 Heme oxygenase-like protein [uncultured Microbacterium sp.]
MTEPAVFSAVVRDRSHAAHSGSEGAGFMTDLMAGRGSLDDYAALVVQHWFIYDALEDAAGRLRANAAVAPFLSAALDRVPSIEADLDHLLGPAWRGSVVPLPTTVRYVERIREVAATWPGGLVAHHYTRYLGDLSGGQFIRRILARQFGFAEDGVRFYRFEEIADTRAFKEGYRELLDRAPWDPEEQERIVEEVLRAYRFNTELFDDLLADRAARVT